MKKILFFVLSFQFYNMSNASEHCFPENNLSIPVPKYNFFETPLSGLSEGEFSEVTDRFQQFWNPILKEKYQKSMAINSFWNESRIDASATRDNQNNLIINVFGGLARHPEITKNGLLIILCHELGHYLGGAPKSFRGKSEKRSWSSAEGQADYFATAKCIPKMIAHNEFYPEKPFTGDDNLCANNLCKKILSPAISVGNLFASLKSDWKRPSPTIKSNQKVKTTIYQHPNPQCRLDTFIAGSLCTQELDTDFDNLDPKIGSCFDDFGPEGSRPQCWFSPDRY